MDPGWELETDFPGVGDLATRSVWGQGGGRAASCAHLDASFSSAPSNHHSHPPKCFRERSGLLRGDSQEAFAFWLMKAKLAGREEQSFLGGGSWRAAPLFSKPEQSEQKTRSQLGNRAFFL